jgi:hypothetical protein
MLAALPPVSPDSKNCAVWDRLPAPVNQQPSASCLRFELMKQQPLIEQLGCFLKHPLGNNQPTQRCCSDSGVRDALQSACLGL